MKKKRDSWRTAEELMNELAKDPEYVQRQAEREERFRRRKEKFDRIKQPILARLASAGFPAHSIDDIGKYDPLPDAVVGILLESLTSCPEDAIQDSIVRELAYPENSFDGRPLRNVFATTHSESLKFSILNTIAIAKPHSIDDWLEEIRRHPYYGKKLASLEPGDRTNLR